MRKWRVNAWNDIVKMVACSKILRRIHKILLFSIAYWIIIIIGLHIKHWTCYTSHLALNPKKPDAKMCLGLVFFTWYVYIFVEWWIQTMNRLNGMSSNWSRNDSVTEHKNCVPFCKILYTILQSLCEWQRAHEKESKRKKIYFF